MVFCVMETKYLKNFAVILQGRLNVLHTEYKRFTVEHS
jgi:hypothetical protein